VNIAISLSCFDSGISGPLTLCSSAFFWSTSSKYLLLPTPVDQYVPTNLPSVSSFYFLTRKNYQTWLVSMVTRVPFLVEC
jgi:hypothetical protein